jgi:hypothetical protein
MRAKLSTLQRQRWQDPAYRERQRTLQQQRWQDPVYRARALAILQAPAVRSKAAVARRGRRRSMEARARMSAQRYAHWHDPVQGEQRRAAQRERARQQWQDPDFRARALAARRARAQRERQTRPVRDTGAAETAAPRV